MTRIILANGILTDGEASIDLLGAELRRRGLKVIDVLLPRRSMVSARWGASRDGRALAQVSEAGDVLVGHSFGCLRASYAARLVRYRAVVCIAPAMSPAHSWGSTRVVCYHSRDDRALKASKLLLAHPFGGGGAGLNGFNDPVVENINCNGADHSDYFYGSLMTQIADKIQNLAGAE